MMNHLKDEYLQAAETSKAAGNGNTVYTAEMLFVLHKMAKNDVYPDGRFSDEECNIWSAFR